jgi:hypothetical protein
MWDFFLNSSRLLKDFKKIYIICHAMQCTLYKIYFWKVFHMNYNLICIFICTPICTNLSILVKSGCYVKQVKGEYCCNDPHLAAYLLHVRKLEKNFDILDLHHIPHAENGVADDLSTKAST